MREKDKRIERLEKALDMMERRPASLKHPGGKLALK